MLKERLAVARACILCLRSCQVREGGALVETFRICRTYLATLSAASGSRICLKAVPFHQMRTDETGAIAIGI